MSLPHTSRIDTMRTCLAALDPISLTIIDESHKHAGHVGARNGGGHYVLRIISAQFTGRNTLSRHRMIYSALEGLMKCDIHALNIQAHAPGEV